MDNEKHFLNVEDSKKNNKRKVKYKKNNKKSTNLFKQKVKKQLV